MKENQLKEIAVTHKREKRTELKQWERDIGGMTKAAKKAIFLLVSIQCYLSLLLIQLKETNNIVNINSTKKSKLVY